jgi:hypothetical protein
MMMGWYHPCLKHHHVFKFFKWGEDTKYSQQQRPTHLSLPTWLTDIDDELVWWSY